MAESFKDGEFWLPPQLLYPDDFHMEKKLVTQKGSPKDPFGIPYGYGSCDVTSPVGSTETDSEEEDISLLAGLTQHMANSSLLEDGFPSNGRSFSVENTKYPGWFGSGSPQSTLYRGGCGCREDSCPNGPTTKPQATWELLCAAAAEVERMKINEEIYYKLDREVLGPTRKPSPVFPFPLENTSVPSNLALYHKLQAAHFQQLREQQLLKQQRQSGIWGGQPVGYVRKSGVSNSGSGNGSGRRPLGMSGSSSWMVGQTHQQVRPGMRSVYPVSAKRECAGTGVFLPRRVGSTVTTEPRKMSAGSTVLLPARVVQALNLNLDEMGGAKPRFTADGNAAAALRLRSGDVLAPHQKRSSRAQPAVVNTEVRLPQEWTY